MKCSRCMNEIERKDPLVTLYVHPSDGRRLSFILCPNCTVGLTAFIAQPTMEAAQAEEKEKE